MIIISQHLVLSPIPVSPFGADNPVIGWHNIVTAANIEADSEETDSPAINLANPATHLRWISESTGEQYITVTTNYDDPIDYLAVARHNFASGGIPVSVEGASDVDSPPLFEELVQDVALVDDGPVLFRFEPTVLSQIRLRMQAGIDPPFAGVMYVGKLLILPRRIWQGHTPIKYGRKSKIVNGMSESGNFLGRIVLNEYRESTAQLSLISPAYYRSDIDPFLAGSKEDPFFFAWRPATYPLEVGYAWMMNDPQPVNAGPSGLIELDLQMMGIA